MSHDILIQEYIDKAKVNFDLPGLTAGVSRADVDSIYLSGVMDVETSIPLNEKTVSHFASVSKLFVSTALLKLQEAGKLDLGQKITEIIPWFKMADDRYRDISIRQVLSHTAGMPDIEDYHWDNPVVDAGALKQYVLSPEIANRKLLWDPGTDKFKYSNIGYDMLGEVIAAASGVNFEEFIQNAILKPLDMNDSTFLTFRRSEKGAALNTEDANSAQIMESLDLDVLLKSNMALPHTKDKDNHIIRENYYPYNRIHAPSSTLTSTVTDIFKWGRAHLSRTIMNDSSYKEAWSEITTVPNNGEKMGLGWFKRIQNGYALYGHEGSDDGFRSSFWICPELDTQIIVLSNITRAPVKKINKTIFEMLFESDS